MFFFNLMKRFLFRIFLLLSLFSQGQTPGEWTWMKGDSVSNSQGNLGTQGISSPLNDPPNLYEACEWTDLNGNFWIFGGKNQINLIYSDLYKYDPVINEWTWMKGPGITGDSGYFG